MDEARQAGIADEARRRLRAYYLDEAGELQKSMGRLNALLRIVEGIGYRVALREEPKAEKVN